MTAKGSEGTWLGRGWLYALDIQFSQSERAIPFAKVKADVEN